MDNRHTLMFYGKKRMNWENRPSSGSFVDRHGKTAKVPSTKAPGIPFAILELNHEGEGSVFRVGDVILHDAIALDWDRWQPDDRGVAPNGKRIGEQFASNILEEAIRMNPEQTDELSKYRQAIQN